MSEYGSEGLLPVAWMEVEQTQAPRKWLTDINWAGEFKPVDDSGWVWLAGDASGGEHASVPVLRRVGVGVVQGTFGGEIAGPMLGYSVGSDEPQDVGYGELSPLCTALESTAANVVYLADNDGVVDGWAAKHWNQIMQQNLSSARSVLWPSLWIRVGRAAKLSSRRVIVLAAESHGQWQGMAANITSGTVLRLNTLADEVAKKGAMLAGIPEMLPKGQGAGA